MATQGERRRQAVAAVRAARRVYRMADSTGEKVERELDRLIKRKMLIGPDSLVTLGNLVTTFADRAKAVSKAYVDLTEIILSLPR